MQTAAEFLQLVDHYRLGSIITEKPHPKTARLSHLARDHATKAVNLLHEVDMDALKLFSGYLPEIVHLQSIVQKVLENGGRIFLCGCGATGRLSLFLEYLWRRIYGDDRVIAFMAGGDIALVHALEGFEDFPSYGARHLRQLGFTREDMFIGITEGGETPFVIGATLEAAGISGYRPVFVFCNPVENLISIERCRTVLENPGIHAISLPVGPMALAGSTRMQASTVLQLAVGLALFFPAARLMDEYGRFLDVYENADLDFMEAFIDRESRIYAEGAYLNYRVSHYGITVFTDTTERAPTFSLVPFDNLSVKKEKHSLSYLSLLNVHDGVSAWRELLGRHPRSLNWLSISDKTGNEYLNSFDFSEKSALRRRLLLPQADHYEFRITRARRGMRWDLDGLRHTIATGVLHELFEHTYLKMLLNMHSTLVMGNLERYLNNIMTHVAATNGKLIDRSARYVGWLLRQDGYRAGYRDIVEKIFESKNHIAADEPIVLRVYDQIRNDFKAGATGPVLPVR